MNFDNQTIMHVKAGHLPPDDLLALIIGKKPTALGFIVQNVLDGGKPDLAIVREDASQLTMDELKRFFLNSKDFPTSFYFANLAQGYNPDDIQPFVITDADGAAFMAIMHEGTLNDSSAGEHNEHYSYVNGIIIPKIVEWCEDFQGDLDKIMPKIKSDLFKKEYLTNIGHRGVLHIMPIDGDPVNIGKNDLGGDYDWGWITQKLEATKEQKVEASAPAPKKSFSAGWGKKTPSASPVPATPVQGKDGKPVHDAGSPVEAGDKSLDSRPAKPKDSKSPELVARPPQWLKTNDDVKLWYDIIGGFIHEQWKRRLPIIVKDFEAAKIDNLAAFKKYALEKKLKTTGGNTSAGTPPDATAVHDKAVISGVAGDKELPIIPANKMEAVLDFVAKHLDTSSKEITPPKEIQDMENALPKFSEAVGLDFMETINWPVGGLVGMARTDIMALVCYAVEWRTRYRALKLGQPMAGTTKTTATTTTTTNGSTTKVESVSNEPAPAPKKSFGWGSKKQAA